MIQARNAHRRSGLIHQLADLSDERRRRVFEAFDEPDDQARVAALVDDHERQLLHRLLHGHRDFCAKEPLFRAALTQSMPTHTLPPATQVGGWRVSRLLSAGGMGEVYLARRAGGDFVQVGALKLLPVWASPESAQRRFRQERQTLASLQHAGISPLIDGGVTEEGRLYYVMEYVSGGTILEFCDQQRLTLRQRLQLFAEACAAVHFANQQGCVHCDLKPGNVLIGGDGRVRLIDFGISRRLSAMNHDAQQVAYLRCTPAYASPEQRRGEALDARTDVYSLGVLLHELITGSPAARPEAGVSALRETVASHFVAGASAHALARARRSSATTLRRLLRFDIDRIVATATAPERDERYVNVAALMQDVELYAETLPNVHLPTLRLLRRVWLKWMAALN